MTILHQLVLLVLVCLATGCSSSSSTNSQKPDDKEDLSLPVADFSLTERSGKTVTKADLEGKVWIASFVFTRCTGPCPQVTATMARLQTELADYGDQIRLVTFTVDPTRDDADELKKYAEIYRANKDRWLFLTGKEDVIHQLLIKSFKIPVARNQNPKKAGDEYEHSTRLVLVDKQGNIRGYYQGMADPQIQGSSEVLEADLKKLKKKVESLLR